VLAPDVLVAATGTATVAPLLHATRTVPIVFVTVIDPVAPVSSRALHGRAVTRLGSRFTKGRATRRRQEQVWKGQRLLAKTTPPPTSAGCGAGAKGAPEHQFFAASNRRAGACFDLMNPPPCLNHSMSVLSGMLSLMRSR
jgi:hypothetical protein